MWVKSWARFLVLRYFGLVVGFTLLSWVRRVFPSHILMSKVLVRRVFPSHIYPAGNGFGIHKKTLFFPPFTEAENGFESGFRRVFPRHILMLNILVRRVFGLRTQNPQKFQPPSIVIMA